MRERPKGGRKGRKIGKGVHKLSHSSWGSYDALFNHQLSRRRKTLERRFCSVCETQFHSRAALHRHVCV
jgi:hypothetical protein